MVDVQAQLGAMRRSVEATELDGEPATRPSLSQIYPSPVDDVWDAVTRPERIARWFLPCSASVAAGTDLDVARRQADATFEFYTGQIGMDGEQDPAHHGA